MSIKNQEIIQISLPRNPEYHLAIRTGESLEITQTTKTLIIDAHMHIQSNNIAPCTLQWGTIRSLVATVLANNPDALTQALDTAGEISDALKWLPLWLVGPIVAPDAGMIRIGFMGPAIIIAILADAVGNLVQYLENKDIDDLANLLLRKADKKLLNTIQACISRPLMEDFGRLGVLDTDVVGKVFMGYDGNLDVEDYAVNYQTYEHIKKIYGLDPDKFPFENFVLNKAGELFDTMSEKEAITLMNNRQEMMANFSHFTKYYYKNRDKTHLYITMPMDLGYAHYWGYYSLPIYLPKNSQDLYYISEVPYYLGFMDNLTYFASFVEKAKNKYDRIPPLKVSELVTDWVQNKIIKFSRKKTDALHSTLNNNHNTLDELEPSFEYDPGIKDKISTLKEIITEVREYLYTLTLGKGETNEKGIIEKLNTDIIDYINTLINEYIRETNKQAKEYETYSNVPPEISHNVKPKLEEIERDAEELYKSYHTLSCYAGKRIEDLEEFFKDHFKTLKTRLKTKLLNLLEDCIINLLHIRSQEQMGKRLPQGHFNKKNFNDSYSLLTQNRENIKEDIQFIKNRLKKEVSTIKEQIDVYNAGYNKILWHSIKPGDYMHYFRFGYVQQKSIEKTGGNDEGMVVELLPDDMVETVYFESWSHVLSDEETATLAEMVEDLLRKNTSNYLRFLTKIRLRIKGHTAFTDSKKDDQKYLEDLYNLSVRRANAVKNKILELCGNNKFLFEIMTEGLSYHYPVANNSTAAGHKKNQRAEIYVIQGGISHDDDEYNQFLNKPINHYLEQAPGNEKKYYETYSIQLARTIATGLRYPLKILPFYHYDPRRHYEGGERFLNELVKDIKEYHGFFELLHGENMQKPFISPIDFTDEYLLSLLKKNKSENSYAFDNLDPTKIGLCWGYKMYTMLGYPPNLFDKNTYPGKDDSFKDRFKHFKSFFQHCVDNEIPITCHGSPAAMTIADTILYLKEYNKESPESDTFKDQLYYHIPEEIKESLQYVDDAFVRPESWRKVLGTPGFSNLKICLAHFAGYDSWYEHKGKHEKYANPDWRDELIRLIGDFENVYTDISCYNNDEEQLQTKLSIKEYNDISEQLESDYKRLFQHAYKPVYMYIPVPDPFMVLPILVPRLEKILSHYKLTDDDEEKRVVRRILRRKGIVKDYLDEVAKNMAEKINSEPKLKDRILMGSDWPMFERSFASSGEYYSRMFELLAMVTKYLKEDYGQDWDAWHQFSVVNPLRFIGILKDEDSDKMTLDMEKIEKHRDAIERFLDFEGDEKKLLDLRIKYRIYEDIDKILGNKPGKHSLSENYIKLQQINEYKIDHSNEILDPTNTANLLILKE